MIVKKIILILCACASLHVQAQVNNIIVTIAGNDTLGFSGDGGPATNAKLNNPNYLWVDNFGNLYFGDAANHRVRKIVLSTGIITTVAGTGSPGYNGDNIPATNANLFAPESVCTDSLGNIFISDPFNHRIRKVDVATDIISTIAGNGITGNSGDNGPATNAQIWTPVGLYIDKYGTLYFTDLDNNNVRKVDSLGIIHAVAGNGVLGYAGDNGPATNAKLNGPDKAFADNDGNVIFSDSYNHAIRKVDILTGKISTIAGDGLEGYSGNNGPATNAKLSYPGGVFINDHNDIYFAQAGSGVISRIDGSTGIITAVVGCGTLGFSGDGGPATAAKLRPTDVVIDKYGVMYIDDYKNNRIRMVYNPQLAIKPISLNQNEVLVYPNPVRDELTIEYHFAKSEDATIQITDITGRIIAIQKLIGTKQKEILDIHSLSQGLYLYKVVQNNLLISAGKVLKE